MESPDAPCEAVTQVRQPLGRVRLPGLLCSVDVLGLLGVSSARSTTRQRPVHGLGEHVDQPEVRIEGELFLSGVWVQSRKRGVEPCVVQRN